MTRRKPGRRGAGAMILLSCCFAASGLLRLGTIAEEQNWTLAAQAQATPQVAMANTDQLLLQIQQEKEELAARASALDARAKAIAEAEDRLRTQLAVLNEARAELETLVTLVDTSAEEDLDRLTLIYQNMKPNQAVALFSEMRVDFAAGFLARMDPISAGAILAGLPPDVGYAVSVALAGRNAQINDG